MKQLCQNPRVLGSCRVSGLQTWKAHLEVLPCKGLKRWKPVATRLALYALRSDHCRVSSPSELLWLVEGPVQSKMIQTLASQRSRPSFSSQSRDLAFYGVLSSMERCLRGGVPVEAEVFLALASTLKRLLKLMLTSAWKMCGVLHAAGFA